MLGVRAGNRGFPTDSGEKLLKACPQARRRPGVGGPPGLATPVRPWTGSDVT